MFSNAQEAQTLTLASTSWRPHPGHVHSPAARRNHSRIASHPQVMAATGGGTGWSGESVVMDGESRRLTLLSVS